MPNKKGSKVAASRARAQAAAKKKAKSTGPALPAAAFVKPGAAPEAPEEMDEELDQELEEALATDAEPTEAVATVPTGEQRAALATATQRRSGPRVTATRRHRQATGIGPSPSLRREVGLIGAITVVIGVALAVIKFATDLGS